MTSLETLIGDLLLRHNCVIVPSFGGFVAKQVSAQIDFGSGKMYPPSKSLLFNTQLVNNDGLLVNEYARIHNLVFDEASAVLKNKVISWNRLLSSGGRIELDRVGFIYVDEEKNICFEQDRYFNLLMASYGLGHVNFVSDQAIKREDIKIEPTKQKILIKETNLVVEKSISIIHPEKQETTTKETLAHKAAQTGIIRDRSQAWKYVAAACFLPIAFYSVWIPMKTDVLESGVISVRDFNPFQKKLDTRFEPSKTEEITILHNSEPPLKERIQEISSDVEAYTFKFDEDFFVPVDIRKLKPLDNSQGADNSSETFEVESMHYIVGCFSNKENADNLVEKLNSSGLSAKIVDVHNGLHRVSAGGAMSAEGLQQIKMTTASINLSGWVLTTQMH